MEIWALSLLLVPVVVYVGYPLALIAVAAFVPRRAHPAATARASVTILICAYNEAPRIAAKLDTVVAAVADWPGLAEILVGDDGSDDATATIVDGYADRGVRLVRLPRGGKAAAINRLVPLAIGDVIVMTDADPLFDAQTLPAITAPFADPRVGAVAGSVESIRAARAGRFAALDRVFRRYESAMRGAEDRLFGCVSADGGLFAIRRDLVPLVPPDVTDDFYISTAAVAAGYRIAFTAQARVHEHSIDGDRQQLRRRIRITVRGMTAVWQRRALMSPFRTGWYAVALFFHKLARRLVPLVVPPLWLVSGLLAAQPFWALVFAGLTGLILLGGIGWWRRGKLPKPLSGGYGAVLQLTGMAAGVLLFAGGRRYAQWTPQKDAA